MENEQVQETAPESEAVQRSEDKPINSVDAANKVLEAMKAEGDRIEQLTVRLENAKAEAILSGKADAGQAPEKPKEESPEEYKARVMRNEI